MAGCGLGEDGASVATSNVIGSDRADHDNQVEWVDNPTLDRRCGLDAVLVLDASSSVRNWQNPPDGNGAVDLVASAANAFLRAFSRTNTQVAVVSYNAETIVQLRLTDVNPGTLAAGGEHAEAIGDPGGATGPIPQTTGYSEHARSGSGTNWEGGLLAAQSVLADARASVPRLVVHVTDGIPTRHIDDNGNITDEGNKDVHVEEAAGAADALKNAGVHIYSVGVGRAGSDTDYLDELQAVSGPDVWQQDDPDDAFDAANDDVIMVTDFTELEAVLAGLAGEFCGASLTINKLASTRDAPDTFDVAEGVEFTATPAAASGFDWLLPVDGPQTARTVATDALGRAQFQWSVASDANWGTGTVVVTEAPQVGYELLPEVVCESGGQTFTVTADRDTGTFSVDVGVGDTVVCEVRNVPAGDDPPGDPPDDPDGPDFHICTAVDVESIPTAGGVVNFTVFLFNHDDEAIYLESIHDSVLGDLLDPGNPLVVDGYCTDGLAVGGSYGCSWDVVMQGGAQGETRVHTTDVVFANDDGATATASYEITVTIGD